ncbi:MAG: hypothetical protein DWQ20_05185 [Actinobacteria bacterium]|nr:MAG: hypothetical protein DWQ20_05185 [Actinomycetota bacterium]
MTNTRVREAIEASDTDELLRIVDGHCKARSWDELLALRALCQEAVTRGKQLWGVDEHIQYRLALEAPAEWAGPAVSEGGARFTLGPLPEVAASNKTWAELAPHLSPGPHRMTVAAERILRGDHPDEPTPLPPLLDWEPSYPLATYKPDKVETPEPKRPATGPVELPQSVEVVEDVESEHALADLVEPWIDQSNGRCQTVSVEGEALDAIAALGLPSATLAQLDPPNALAVMAWTAASGGAHGRRRGAAAGRHTAWWVVSAISDLDWPAPPDEVAAAANRIRWFWFDDGSPPGGWELRLALDDPELGLAWAITANDVAD